MMFFFKSDKPKSKSVAIMLAILFGLAAWAYTYKKDKKKFWIALGLSAILIIIFSVAIIAMLSDIFELLSASDFLTANNSVDLGERITGNLPPLIAPLIGLLLLWLWTIFDVAKKPSSWYESYSPQSANVENQSEIQTRF